MLKRVSIQNFKSLKDVTLDLQKVNLLIGPNNSGKTNFLKALEFMGVFADAKKDPAENLYFGQNILDDITIHLIFEIPEQIKFLGSVKTHIKLERSNKFKYELFYSENRTLSLGTQDVSTVNPAKWESVAGKIIIYKPDPNKLAKAGPVGRGEDFVNADASNIVGFLDLMLGKYRKPVFNRIEKDVNTCIAEFDEITIDDAPYVAKELKEQFPENSFRRLGLANSKQEVTYWADELSEGTLYFLALLCIINQPNPPKLLLLEEPEKGIHPRRIREVMDFIFRLSEEKDVQIILTTHNEHVLDDFATRPEAVFVFDKDEEGATYVRNLQKDIIEPTNQRNQELGLDEVDLTTNLSENWLYGLLGGVPTIP